MNKVTLITGPQGAGKSYIAWGLSLIHKGKNQRCVIHDEVLPKDIPDIVGSEKNKLRPPMHIILIIACWISTKEMEEALSKYPQREKAFRVISVY